MWTNQASSQPEFHPQFKYMVLAFQFPHPIPNLAISILKKWFIAPTWKGFHHKYKWYGSLCFCWSAALDGFRAVIKKTCLRKPRMFGFWKAFWPSWQDVWQN